MVVCDVVLKMYKNERLSKCRRCCFLLFYTLLPVSFCVLHAFSCLYSSFTPTFRCFLVAVFFYYISSFYVNISCFSLVIWLWIFRWHLSRTMISLLFMNSSVIFSNKVANFANFSNKNLLYIGIKLAFVKVSYHYEIVIWLHLQKTSAEHSPRGDGSPPSGVSKSYLYLFLLFSGNDRHQGLRRKCRSVLFLQKC